MAVEMFFKVGDFNGEATAKGHVKDIIVLSWSWGLSQSGSTHVGPGSGSGKVNVQDLSFTKYIDTSTPNLLRSCCAGTHIKNALLTVRKAGGDNPVEYLKIQLFDVIVAGVTTGGSGGEDRITENITLNFGQFEVDYTPQNADGSPGPTAPMTWNIPANTATLTK
jgi:type VI secretion system secreted protein Hcp